MIVELACHDQVELVLIKGGEILQRAGDIDTVVLDKTGTVTEGTPTVERIIPLGSVGENEMISVAASLERHSEHPLATAIVRAGGTRHARYDVVDSFQTGNGYTTDGHDLILLPNGHAVLMDKRVSDRIRLRDTAKQSLPATHLPILGPTKRPTFRVDKFDSGESPRDAAHCNALDQYRNAVGRELVVNVQHVYELACRSANPGIDQCRCAHAGQRQQAMRESTGLQRACEALRGVLAFSAVDDDELETLIRLAEYRREAGLEPASLSHQNDDDAHQRRRALLPHR